MKIGCHISIAKGFCAAATDALALGAESFQYFTKNPRGFRGKKQIDPDDAARGLALCRSHDLAVVAHAPYILNLSTPKPDLWQLTIDSLLLDLEICTAYATPYLVVHCGKHVGEGAAYGLQRMVESLDTVLDRYAGTTMICLENTAGQGTEMGTTLEQLLEIRARVCEPERIGFCWDSCHAFVAGQYRPDAFAAYARAMAASGFLAHLRVVHLNDSRAEFGSRRDRHELVGQGFIGAVGLGAILKTPAFADLPVILETPVEQQGQYAAEIAWCRAVKNEK